MIEFQNLLEIIDRLEAAFNTRHNKKTNLASIWQKEFKDVSVAQFEKAVDWWIKHSDRFPTIHQLYYALKKVGGLGTAEKKEFYAWVDKETMDNIPVVYYFKLGPHIYSCLLEKNKEKMPPENFMTKYGVRAWREDIWKEKQGENWELGLMKQRQVEKKEKPLKEDIEILKERAKKLLRQ